MSEQAQQSANGMARNANAVVTELQEIANILIARCARHASDKAEVASGRDDALAAAKASLAEIETLKAEKADLSAQISKSNTPAA